MIPTRIRRLIADTENYSDWKKEFHPEPNVRNHLGQVATLAIEAEDNWDVVYAAVLHDIAKNCPDYPKKWAQHAFRGAMLVASDVTAKVQWLISQHMRAIDYASGKMRKHKQEALRNHAWFEDLMRLHQYDCGGRNADGKHLPWEMGDWYEGSTIFGYLDAIDPRVNQVIIMVGIQASGKSTVSHALVDASRDHGDWWKPKFERTSKDDLRLLLGAGPGGYRHQESCVNRVQRDAIRMALGRGQGIVVDNCHNTVKRRRDILEWLRQEFPGIHVRAHFVYADLQTCIERNRDQHGQPHRHRLLIPETVLKQFHGDMKQGFGNAMHDNAIINNTLIAEGFDEVDITRTA